MNAISQLLLVSALAVFYSAQKADAVCCTGKSLAQCRPDGNRGTAATKISAATAVSEPLTVHTENATFLAALAKMVAGTVGVAAEDVDVVVGPSIFC